MTRKLLKKYIDELLGVSNGNFYFVHRKIQTKRLERRKEIFKLDSKIQINKVAFSCQSLPSSLALCKLPLKVKKSWRFAKDLEFLFLEQLILGHPSLLL